MNEAQNEEIRQWEDLPCDCIVYRAILNRPGRDKVTGRILMKAFLRRGPVGEKKRDEQGLSVALFPGENLSKDDIINRIRSSYKDCFAIGSLLVGKIRDIQTEPRLDVKRNEKNHANITWLPAFEDNETEKANYLADMLAEITRPFWNL